MTWIFLWSSAPSKIFVGDTQVSKVFVGDTKVRPTLPDYLCFTANTAGSTVQLTKVWSPTSVTLETSTDWTNWTTYTFGDTITLSNVWDKVYWRNTSETDTWFGSWAGNHYRFSMTWSIAWSWDINYLLNKNSTTTIISNNCFSNLFISCTALKTPPKLPATTLTQYCYSWMFSSSWLTKTPKLPATTLANLCYASMFNGCTDLTELPELPATTLASFCYTSMFKSCSKIKLSTTQTWDYQTEYRIPIIWTWIDASDSMSNMFTSSWWTFTWTPSINTTYYTSNTVV